MKILDNGVVREMTVEEIERFFAHPDDRESEWEMRQKAAAYDILTGVNE